MKKILFLIVACLFFLWNCKNMPDMSDPKDAIPPGTISAPVVENINGGSIITYTLPDDKDILGVKAIYSLTKDGKKLEMFASAYHDTIELRGFPDTEERNITLFCIDKSFNNSESIEVKIKPLTPPIDLIRETFKVTPSFGGIYVKWVNDYKENIAISIYAEDSLGIMNYDDTYYSVSPDGKFTFRGFANVETRFRIEIRDRWDNYAEPLEFTLTPFYEEEILSRVPVTKAPIWDIAYGAFDGSRMWRGDVLEVVTPWSALYSNARNTWGLIDDGDKIMSNDRWAVYLKPQLLHYFPEYKGDKQYLNPAYFIFDLKEEIIPSRLKFWPYPLNETVFPDQIEVWGSVSTPKQNIDFNDETESLNYWTSWNFPPYVVGKDAWKKDWIKLGSLQIRPTPSGAYILKDWTVDDIALRDRGFDLEVDPDVIGTKVRYVRFIYINTVHEQCYTKEIKLWGQYPR